MQNRKVKKAGAPEVRAAVATRGGVLPIHAIPLRSRRLTAEEYTVIFVASPKRHRDVRILSSTPIKEEDVDEDEGKDEDHVESAFETEQSAA